MTSKAQTDSYILNADGDPEPCPDLLTWARWFGAADRHLADTHVGDVRISTVFLGLDHNFCGGPPILWETLVFGGALDGEMDRYGAKAEALAGHDRIVARVRTAADAI